MSKRHLPDPGKDAGQWGDILNSYLRQSLGESGGVNKWSDTSQRPQNLTPDDKGLTGINIETGHVEQWNGSRWDVLTNSLTSFQVDASGSVSQSLQDKIEERASITDFGGRGDFTTDNTLAFNAAVRFCQERNSKSIFFPAGAYVFNFPPEPIGTGVTLIGEGSAGASYPHGVTLVKNYEERDNRKGFLTWNGNFADYRGTGGGMENITVLTTKPGGIGILLTGLSPERRAGYMHFDHVKCFGGRGGMWYRALEIRGGNLTVKERGQGIRDAVFVGCYFASAADRYKTVLIENGVSIKFLGSIIYSAGAGSAGLFISGTGSDAVQRSTYIDYFGTILGNFTADYCNIVSIYGNITGNVALTENAWNVNIYSNILGDLQDNSLLEKGNFIFSRKALGKSLFSGNGYQTFPGGIIFQWFSVSLNESFQDYNYPYPFPNATLAVVATPDSEESHTVLQKSANHTKNTASLAASGQCNATVIAIGY